MKGWMGLAVTVAVAGMPLMAQGRVSTQTSAASARSSMAVGEPVYFSETQSEGFVMPIAGPIREFEPLTDFDADFLADIEQALAKQRIASSAQTKQTDAASEVLLSAEGALEAGDEIFGEDSRVDWYEFQGEAGQVVMLTIESEDFTPFAGLFETTTDGAEAVASATSADGNTATVVVTLPNSSRYIVAAIAANEAPGEGSYRLSVTIASAAAGRQAEQQTEADRLFQQGIQQHRTSQFHSAIQSWQQALEIYRTIGNRQGEANSLGNLGLAYLSLGQYQRAIEFHQQSLDIDRDIGNRQGEANSLGNLGLAYHSLGQYQRAIEFHQQTLAIARDIGDRQGEAASLGNLGLAYDSLDQYQRAIEFHQQTLAIVREIGDRQGEALSLNNLGSTYIKSNRLAEGETVLR
ncbi:MAG: tetratricopeptide repeat protein, partial [Cyanobacteria bacterium P01_H01_bin.119]